MDRVGIQSVATGKEKAVRFNNGLNAWWDLAVGGASEVGVGIHRDIEEKTPSSYTLV